jgi:hypothetical protein
MNKRVTPVETTVKFRTMADMSPLTTFSQLFTRFILSEQDTGSVNDQKNNMAGRVFIYHVSDNDPPAVSFQFNLACCFYTYPD